MCKKIIIYFIIFIKFDLNIFYMYKVLFLIQFSQVLFTFNYFPIDKYNFCDFKKKISYKLEFVLESKSKRFFSVYFYLILETNFYFHYLSIICLLFYFIYCTRVLRRNQKITKNC